MTDAVPRSIPLLDLAPEVEELWDDLNAAFQRVLRSGHFILGPEVEAFEREVADYLGCRHAVGVNSGTDALVIGLRALGIGPGDEVITTPFSFFATAEAICNVGATPVFVDIDERSFNIDPRLVEGAVTARTKAIVPVHLYGRPCDMDAIVDIAERCGLEIVEDCAQSFGARVRGRQTGTFGQVGAYSFFPTKNLGGFGDGGLIATDDGRVAERARMLRAHGSKKKYENETLGYNSRLDALQAALLRVKLPYVDGWNQRRAAAAMRYGTLFGREPSVTLPDVTPDHVFHQYTVRVPSGARDAVQHALAAAGVSTAIYYPTTLPALAAMSDHVGVEPERARRAAEEALSLPIGPNLSHVDQAFVVASVVETITRTPA